MSQLLRFLTLLSTAWAAATASLFAALAVIQPSALSGPDAVGFILGGLLVALGLVPIGLFALQLAERSGMRITPSARMMGAVLICAIPLFAAVIVLQERSPAFTPTESVAFAFAGVVVGVVVGAAYPWVRGPFRRGPREKPREDVEGPGEPVAR
ncbi:MAG TPA: hypothetical protein VMK65_02735 [Longimicrobiales bacterium]|nr:hypothetical protein [Longimicrobiales bacterium]